MTYFIFAAEEAAEHTTSGIGALGINLGAFIIQLVSFLLVFLLLKKFAFKPIVKLLQERRQTIDDGVRLGQQLEKQRDKQNQEHEAVVREARHEADRIIANAHKEARDVARDAEKAARHKTEVMVADAEERINEETDQARRRLEKDIAALVSEATEAVVKEKIDEKKDRELIDKTVKELLKK